jgi:uncharacterized RDD family membrane protein YckC
MADSSPYEPPRAPIDAPPQNGEEGEAEAGYFLYAKIWPRMKAILVDGFVLAGAFVIAAVVGANLPGSGGIAFVVWVAFWILYDPVMVSRTGGTVGHHLQNLRVVSDRTGGPPSLVIAFIRNVVKGLLGIVSLLAMAGSTRQKTLHDLVAGTTVQARDPQLARLGHFTRVRRTPGG